MWATVYKTMLNKKSNEKMQLMQTKMQLKHFDHYNDAVL